MANLVQGIFQGLPVRCLHSPVALPFHPDEQAGIGCKARTHVHQCVMLVRRPLSHPGGIKLLKRMIKCQLMWFLEKNIILLKNNQVSKREWSQQPTKRKISWKLGILLHSSLTWRAEIRKYLHEIEREKTSPYLWKTFYQSENRV